MVFEGEQLWLIEYINDLENNLNEVEISLSIQLLFYLFQSLLVMINCRGKYLKNIFFEKVVEVNEFKRELKMIYLLEYKIFMIFKDRI